MELTDVAGWAKAKENNTDPYGTRILSYAEDWADLMEARMAKGETLASCAQATSREADTDGISGFMYGAAVFMLSQAWVHGDALRRWNNLDLQIGDEGERANESGGVLNPALLNIG